MDDKPPELAALQEAILKTLETFSKAIEELIQQSNERERTRLRQEMDRLSSVPGSTLLAGQFRRRDGDGFGSVPRKFTQDAPNADHKTGDL